MEKHRRPGTISMYPKSLGTHSSHKKISGKSSFQGIEKEKCSRKAVLKAFHMKIQFVKKKKAKAEDLECKR